MKARVQIANELEQGKDKNRGKFCIVGCQMKELNKNLVKNRQGDPQRYLGGTYIPSVDT